MSEENYDLTTSSKALGKLYPILKDAQGNIIDGFHRQNADPDWPSITLDLVNSPVKLELARLAVNFCRRTVKDTEFSQKIAFLIKQGLKVEEIAEQTGIHVSTIFRHMPQELKDQSKVEAGKIGGSARTCEQTVTTCDNCHVSMPTEDLKAWNGNKLCGRCYAQALDHPAQFHQRLEPQMKEAPKILNPAKDSWTNREAQMHPQKSKMELEMLEVFMADNELRPVQSDRRFPLLEVTPDFVFPRHNLAVFLDGKEVHANREDRDQALREKLMKRHGVKVLSITYSSNSDTEKARIMKLVKEAV